MFREDGSIKSAHTPVWSNRYQLRDYGLYRGVVRATIFPEDENNNSSGIEEVLYNVMVIGGDRDGQLFNNARLMRTLGGFSNYEEITLKHLEGVTKADPTSLLAVGDLPISDIQTFNGDVVYLQFLNGDLHMPVIVGTGYHRKAEAEASADEAPRYRRKYNGVYTEITRDGEFTWSKDNGAYVPFLLNPNDPLYPYVSQFAPLPGQEQAVKVTLDNQYNLRLEFLLGLNANVSGTDDTFEFATTSGASLKLSGSSTDSLEATTAAGTSLKVEGGTTDAVTLGTAVGTELKVDGAGDKISLTGAGGDSLEISAADGIQASISSGASLSMQSGAVTVASAGGAQLALSEAGTIQFGSASVDVLKDVLQALIQALTTEAPAGYGAPLVNSSQYLQLLTKIQSVTGG